MRGLRRLFLVSVIASSSVLSACYASHGREDGDDDISDDGLGWPDPGPDVDEPQPPDDQPVADEPAPLDVDSLPECPFDDGTVHAGDAAQPFCQEAGMGYARFCPPTGDGHGYLNWHAEGLESRFCEDEADCNACVCFQSCSFDDECRDGETGAATPQCVILPTGPSQCFLTCDDGEECPAHMQCVDMLEFRHFVCAWMTTGNRCE
jgi:hypothetical protein